MFKGPLKYLAQTQRTVDSSSKKSKEKRCSIPSVVMLKGYHFLSKVYERVTFSVKNGIWKGKGYGPRDGTSWYKNSLSTPPPGCELGTDHTILSLDALQKI